ncbi:MAG: hypothetical protein WDM90_18845 [Ferruginibacter sp.]
MVSCDAKKAQDFNNRLVQTQNNLVSEGNTIKHDTIDDLQKFQRIRDMAKTKLKEISTLQSPDGGDSFKEAMQEDFQGIIDTYEIMIAMVKQRDNTDSLNILKQKFSDWQSKLGDLDQKVIEEQKKFADKYHIKLQ